MTVPWVKGTLAKQEVLEKAICVSMNKIEKTNCLFYVIF